MMTSASRRSGWWDPTTEESMAERRSSAVDLGDERPGLSIGPQAREGRNAPRGSVLTWLFIKELVVLRSWG